MTLTCYLEPRTFALDFELLAFNLSFSNKNPLSYLVLIMTGTGNGSKNEYMFKKLQGSYNYKQLIRDISFAFEKARLWRHVESMTVAPPPLKPKSDDTEDQMEKIIAKEEKICEFEGNAQKAVANIGKMCTDRVQKEFLLLNASKEWTLEDI